MPAIRYTWLDAVFAGYAQRAAARAAAKAANPLPIAAEVAVAADADSTFVVKAEALINYPVLWERLDSFAFYPASIFAGFSLDTSDDVRSRANAKVVVGGATGVLGWATGSEAAKETSKDLHESAKEDYKTASKLQVFGILGAAMYFAAAGSVVGIYWIAEQGLLKPVVNAVKYLKNLVVSYIKAAFLSLLINPLKSVLGYTEQQPKLSAEATATATAKNDWDPRIALAEVVTPPPSPLAEHKGMFPSWGNTNASRTADETNPDINQAYYTPPRLTAL